MDGRVMLWWRSHPRVLDVALVVLTLPAAFAPGIAAPGGRSTSLDQIGSLLVLAAGLMLLARRDAPRLVGAAVVALVSVALSRTPGASQAVVPALVALTTVAARERLAVTVAASAATVAAFVAALGVGGVDTGEAVRREVLPWIGLAAMLGVVARAQREAVDAALSRAASAERSREDEAQRRVAEERLRIARDLHDVLAHQVAVVAVQAGVAQHLLERDPDGAAQALAHVRDATGEVMRELPVFLGVLRADDSAPPAPTIRDADALLESARRSGLEVTSTVSGDPDALDAGTSLSAYRVLQEALTNAAKHGVGSIEVTITHHACGTEIEALNPLRAGAADTTSGHGLLGLRERVAAHGGRVEAGRHAGLWRLRVHLPAARAPEAPADGAAR